MKQFMMVFYVVFFSTGFMGGAALLLLNVRVRSRMLRPLLVFQLLFLVGTGLILVYFAQLETSMGNPLVEVALPAVIMVINTVVWITVIVMARLIAPSSSRRYGATLVAQVFAVLVIVKSIVNVVVISVATPDIGQDAWHLASHIFTAFAMVSFGIVLRGPVSHKEPPALYSLFKAYGTLAIVFAPAGLVEYLVQAAGITWLPYLSLDHFLYLSWNVVSMSAAVQLFRPAKENATILSTVPEERIQALGLSVREVEMAIMIGRGLTNKEIATQLFISPATVRTHIYNLYRKVGAGSRVELLNMLRN